MEPVTKREFYGTLAVIYVWFAFVVGGVFQGAHEWVRAIFSLLLIIGSFLYSWQAWRHRQSGK